MWAFLLALLKQCFCLMNIQNMWWSVCVSTVTTIQSHSKRRRFKILRPASSFRFENAFRRAIGWRPNKKTPYTRPRRSQELKPQRNESKILNKSQNYIYACQTKEFMVLICVCWAEPGSQKRNIEYGFSVQMAMWEMQSLLTKHNDGYMNGSNQHTHTKHAEQKLRQLAVDIYDQK